MIFFYEKSHAFRLNIALKANAICPTLAHTNVLIFFNNEMLLKDI